MADPQAEVWAALEALTRPVTKEAALAAAASVLDPLGRTQQFQAWFEANGEAVLRKLNG